MQANTPFTSTSKKQSFLCHEFYYVLILSVSNGSSKYITKLQYYVLKNIFSLKNRIESF